MITTREEEILRRDVTISQLTERIPAIEAPRDESEAPEDGPGGATEGTEPRSTAGEGQENEQRLWWRT